MAFLRYLHDRLQRHHEARRLTQLKEDKGSGLPRLFRFNGFSIAYLDGPSLYTECRDIFSRQIYSFSSDTTAPLVIDGGAHIGVATLYFKQIYPAARVLCFEPDETSCRLLRQNIADNSVKNVQVIQAAVARSNGHAIFAPDGADGGRIVDGAGVSIKTARLSDYLSAVVDFVKLNIEGQELHVLLEIEERRRLHNIRELVLEYHGWPDGSQGLGPILDILDRNGFRYLVHDFDEITNPASKPPFRLSHDAPWFCLVYAKQEKKESDEEARS